MTKLSPACARVVDVATRHPVASVFLAALTVRLITVAVIAITTGGTLFGDDYFYTEMARDAALGLTGNWDDYTHYLYDGTATFTWPVTAIYEIFGPKVVLSQLFVGLIGAATAGVVTRVALGFLRPGFAVAAGLVIAMLPSQILWSSLVLKDPLVALLLATTALLVVWMTASRSPRQALLWGAAIVVALLLLGRLREQTLIVACIALVAASATGVDRFRWHRLGGSLVALLLIPWMSGLGVAGVDFITTAGPLPEVRERNARDAATAFVEVADPTANPGEPAEAGGKDAGGGKAAPGVGGDRSEVVANLSHLPRGLSVMLLEPYPWQEISGTSEYFDLARWEPILWYPLLILALLGLVTLRRNFEQLAFPLLAGAGSLTVYALAEGNIGTAIRHRSEFVWVVALLVGAGLSALQERRVAEAGRG